MKVRTSIVIGVPGGWASRTSIARDIAAKSNGLTVAGAYLIEAAAGGPAPAGHGAGERYPMEITEHDPHLARAFERAGWQSLTQTELQDIRAHTFAVYLTAEGGSPEQAQKVMALGCGLLRAGGLAVKVETTGKAHSAADWRALTGARTPAALYRAFVGLVEGNGSYYSCGMHNLGYRDAIVWSNLWPADAARLLQKFLLYVLTEKPRNMDRYSFSEAPGTPSYSVRAVPCDTYPPDHPFYNPFGMWRLEPVA
jgi:hypothetical protein